MLEVGKQYHHKIRGLVTVLKVADGKGETQTHQGPGLWVTLRLDAQDGNILKQRLEPEYFTEVAATGV